MIRIEILNIGKIWLRLGIWLICNYGIDLFTEPIQNLMGFL